MPMDTELHKAANKGELGTIVELVEQENADVNEKGASDRTALHRAAGVGAIDVVQYLLKKGATLDPADRYQRTPLFWAATAGHSQVLELLLLEGANPIVSTTTGTTALMAAVSAGSLPCVEALISHVISRPERFAASALVLPQDGEGNTAYALAKALPSQEIALAMRERLGVHLPPSPRRKSKKNSTSAATAPAPAATSNGPGTGICGFVGRLWQRFKETFGLTERYSASAAGSIVHQRPRTT